MLKHQSQVSQFFSGIIKALIFFFGLLGFFIIIGGYSQTLFALILTITVIAVMVGSALGLFKGIQTIEQSIPTN